MEFQRVRRRRRSGLSLVAAILGACALSACASTGPAEQATQPAEVNDPFEPLNRQVFAVNEALDRVALRPIATAYREVTPAPAREGVTNFLRNLRSPLIMGNNLLQSDLDGFNRTATRFFVNTILGLGGVIDIQNMNNQGYPYVPEDFGQTLAVWGFGEGPYLVLPVLGPSNARDTLGLIVDSNADPVRIVASTYDADGFLLGRTVAEAIDGRAGALEATDELARSSLDYYATMRSVYTQLRRAQILDRAAGTTTVISLEAAPSNALPGADDFIDPAAPASSLPGAADFIDPTAP